MKGYLKQLSPDGLSRITKACASSNGVQYRASMYREAFFEQDLKKMEELACLTSRIRDMQDEVAAYCLYRAYGEGTMSIDWQKLARDVMETVFMAGKASSSATAARHSSAAVARSSDGRI